MHKLLVFAAASLCVSMPLQAKKEQAVTGLQLQQIQSRDIEASKDVAFSAVMSVLQDEGYRIGSADRDTGLITGSASTKAKFSYSLWSGMGKKKQTPVVSAYIEPRGANGARVRLNFVMAKLKSNVYGTGAQDEEPIVDPEVYRSAFEKINQAVFVRLAMDSPPASPSSAAPQKSDIQAGMAPK